MLLWSMPIRAYDSASIVCVSLIEREVMKDGENFFEEEASEAFSKDIMLRLFFNITSEENPAEEQNSASNAGDMSE